MNEHTTFCLINGKGVSLQGNINVQSHSILEGRLFIRDILVFSKGRVCWLSFKTCWMNLVRASMCAIMSSKPMEGTNNGGRQIIIPVGNKICSSGLEEREVGNFRNLTWLCIQNILLVGGSTVRNVEMYQGWWDIWDRISTFSPLSMVCVAFQV